MISPQLIATLEKLPPELQDEILHYAEYLATKYHLSTKIPSKKYRKAGTLAGKLTLDPDFDEPLEKLQNEM